MIFEEITRLANFMYSFRILRLLLWQYITVLPTFKEAWQVTSLLEAVHGKLFPFIQVNIQLLHVLQLTQIMVAHCNLKT